MASAMTARYVSSLAPSSMQPNPIDSALLNLSTLNRNSNGYYSDLEEKITFQIRLSDPSMSVNDISVEVENLGEPAEVNVHAFNHQEAEVTVMPRERVHHKITVRYHGQIVNGCPFDVMISPEPEPENPIPSLEALTLSKPKQGKLSPHEVHRDFNVMRSAPGTIHLSTNGNSVMLGDEHEVYLDVSEAGEGDLSVEVSNGRRNLPIQTIPNGNGYTIRILANSVGVYNVYINWNGKFISDNPLKLIVHDRGKVSVYGDGIEKALVGHPASFIVDSRAHGDGVLKAKVKGPTSRAKTSIAENPDGTRTVMYVPSEAGLHTISVFLSEQEIPGSPFVAEVKKKKAKQPSAVHAVSTRNREPAHAFNPVVATTRANHNISAIPDENTILVFGDGLTSVLEGQIAGFVIDPRNASAGGDLTIQITGPNSFAKCNVQQNQDGTLTATYVPGEVGTFTIDISWSGKHIKGSPFRAQAINPSKIALCGKQQNNGYIRFEVGRPNVIEFDTSSAGKGVLTAFVDGPVGQHMNVMMERGPRSSIITYNPPVEGEYKLHILWSGKPIPNSPFYIICENRRSHIDLTRIHATGLMADMVVNGTYEFVIDGSAVEYGVPSAYMQGFSESIPIQIVPQHGNVYTATFTPKNTGAYHLHIKWSGHDIPGSPFSVSVNEMRTEVVEETRRNGFQQSMGTKLPNTLRTGKAYSLTIDANEVGGAKVGEMAVTCDGPTSSVPVEIRDNFNNTFDIMLTPSEIGSHLLNIKVNGSHIEGSPFSFDVSGANQVSCYGQGLSGGPLSTYDSSFQCDTRTAGAGQLKVRAQGPKGAFNVEILPSLKNRRILNVKFHPSTKGVYTLNVQWNDEHVPGSPFKIKLTE